MNLACVNDWETKAAQARYRPGQMARAMEVSVRTLERFFRAALKESPRHWLENRRDDHACALLREGRLSMKQVAAAVGFDDAAAFGRDFKARHGCSPHRFQMRRRRKWLFLIKPAAKRAGTA